MKIPPTNTLIPFFSLLFSGPVLSALVGFGLNPYNIFCASACHWSLLSSPLSCSASIDTPVFIGWAITSNECKANDTAFLTTLAWCLHTKCNQENGYRVSELENFWETQATRDMANFKDKIRFPKPPPKWTYSEALAYVFENGPPNRTMKAGEVLNFTSIVPEKSYVAQMNTAFGVTREQVLGATYGIIILVTGFALPILCTWLYHLPFSSSFVSFLSPRITYPSSWGTYSVRPLPYLIGNAPTVGQAIYIAVFFALNIILMSINYHPFQPHLYYKSESDEIKAYIFYRTGIAAYAILPLLILFSSRNNFLLLWLTNWSHATYLLLHRWVARVFVLHALVHSFLALPLFLPQPAVVSSGYWAWGAVATVLCVVILAASVLPIRRWSYEIFLASHIVLSVIMMVGLWYHVVLWVGVDTWGYETWIYAACAVWFVDRAARAGKVLKQGVRKGRVRELGNGYVRVDVPGVRFGGDGPGLHVYCHFPMLSLWRPWENHPFSVVPTSMWVVKGEQGGKDGRTSGDSSPSASKESGKGVEVEVVDVEKQHGGLGKVSGNMGITLLIKKGSGMTTHLKATEGLWTLLDGPYRNASTTEIRRCDRLLLIGGGIGITSLLPWIASHPNVKLYWSVKESAKCLVEEVERVLVGVEKEVRIGKRLHIVDLLAQEVETGYKRIGVVVSGPGGLCDDVRAAVVAAERKGGTEFELDVDAYSW
ncbi:putative ferric reductase transmembrane component [Podospora australis]|uniref:Ferric reductase transmembrane component n=1 Tax=Podospora australis TaxID=1536484 RepID=A0AAN6WL28_9PEZI|nr:putative ferric reductase transmembrane component [Podospora australis]